MKSIADRLRNLESRFAIGTADYDSDNFIKALGLDPENYKAPNGGYDMMAALADAVDNSDWNEQA